MPLDSFLVEPTYVLCTGAEAISSTIWRTKCEKIFISKYDFFWRLMWICFLPFGWSKFNQNCFLDQPVCKLQLCKSVLIEFAPTKLQK